MTRYKFRTYLDDGTTTLGVDSIYVSKSNAHFTYHDTAGQDKFRAIVESFYRGCDACLIAFDLTSQNSFDEIQYY